MTWDEAIRTVFEKPGTIIRRASWPTWFEAQENSHGEIIVYNMHSADGRGDQALCVSRENCFATDWEIA